jgi:oxygen-dependent protoporphyrinogen oxidase
VIETFRENGCVIDGGPDSFLAAKPEALALCKELGLESAIISSNDHLRKTYIRRRGRMIEMPDGLMMMVPTKIMPVALSPLLSWQAKIRMGLEYFRKPAPANGDRSIADFIGDHYGREAVDYLAEPLLSGVYGGDPRQLSVASVLPRFADLDAKYGSLTKGVLATRPNASSGAAPSLFKTLKGGLGQLVDAVTQAARPHAEFRQAAAEAVEFTGTGVRVRAAGDWIDADHVVFACETFRAAPLIGGRLGELLNQTGYSSSVVVIFGFEGPPPMDGFGFLVPRAERRQILACTWVGTKFPNRVRDGLNVARCFLAGEAEPDLDSVLGELHDLAKFSVRPLFTRVYRWPRAMAQYSVGHAARLEEIERLATAQPRLHLAGNGYRGIGIPDCIRSGQQAAQAALTSA